LRIFCQHVGQACLLVADETRNSTESPTSTAGRDTSTEQNLQCKFLEVLLRLEEEDIGELERGRSTHGRARKRHSQHKKAKSKHRLKSKGYWLHTLWKLFHPITSLENCPKVAKSDHQPRKLPKSSKIRKNKKSGSLLAGVRKGPGPPIQKAPCRLVQLIPPLLTHPASYLSVFINTIHGQQSQPEAPSPHLCVACI
jgi:hypothetical protein